MAAINYGTVAVVPKGVWDSATQYNVANLVTYDGSSYLAHTKPPVGTVPTDTTYWQVSAQGTNKATADAIGVVKPDGETIAVDAAGTISAKKATESTFGIVSGGTGGVIVGADGVMSVDTTFTQATELANIIAAEAFSTVLGKVSKAIATTMNLDENALLKSMLSSVDVNDTTKIPTSAYIHQLVERIGMGTDLDVGSNLTEAVNQQNSDLTAMNSSLTTADSNLQSQITAMSTQKELWSGGSFMNGDQTITLSENVSAQKSGIILCWVDYDETNSVALKTGNNYFFVPKEHISHSSGSSVGMTLTTAGFAKVGAKLLYIGNSTISGHANNATSGTTNGITWNNRGWVLRKVLGV